MNDEPGPSTHDRPLQPSAADLHHESGDAPPSVDAPEPDAATVAAEQRKKVKARRVGRLDDLLRNLDILIYAELSAVYYLDCSFLRLVLRAFVQLIWLTPKPEILPDFPMNRPFIYPICGSNLICLFLHLWFPPPTAGETTKGYLHGGLLIDWIGQQGPTSKFHLLLLDLLILALQLVMLSAYLKSYKLKKNKEPTETNTGARTAGAARGTTAARPRQDVDSEERGILRRSSSLSDLQDRTPPSERDELLNDTRSLGSSSLAATLDTLESGQAVVADLYVADTVREQVNMLFNGEYMTRDATTTSSERRRELLARLGRRRFAFTARLGGG
ncbi:uncharacterized protein K452DRAFT_309355 [Aplosporella prunicola CBS 121167]|uniref:DUF1746 domain-containing protein n=1 Tax=Aplosporella prunicola CBS 121167 TaxID=1176127 RepID=A0A6A6B9D5_9PEZI|nr:uncharacterized protein K452DRAFT_309355 [Aplosporella prunicola CBS 121167]KAF2140892.1 hypothetical protein K452DRAFT_309355 [Aplosporella prunicola CBS 121167]